MSTMHEGHFDDPDWDWRAPNKEPDECWLCLTRDKSNLDCPQYYPELEDEAAD